MHRALLASALAIAKLAVFEPCMGILKQLKTVGAQFLVPLLLAAIERNHFCYCAFFLFNACHCFVYSAYEDSKKYVNKVNKAEFFHRVKVKDE